MATRVYDLSTQSLGNIANFVQEVGEAGNVANQSSEAKNGSLASRLVPKPGKGEIDVVNDYKWTLSNLSDTTEVPYIRIKEYKCNESSIRKQLNLYSNVAPETARNAVGQGGKTEEVLSVYEDIFPQTNPTGFSYRFPYFNQIGFELRSQQWQSLDSIGESLKEAAGGISKMLPETWSKKVEKLVQAGEAIGNITDAAMNSLYPSVGIADRPKIFTGHENRQVVISFPLYNTVNENDWAANRDLVYLLMSQNLFNKRDYVTGVPPVFYDIFIPGQYFCWAAAMTDIKVENLGNQRLLYQDFIVPDAYQVTLTLSELVMPSRNQFEAITNGSARSYVSTK